MKKERESGCCCSGEDLFITFCTVAGLVCLCGLIIDISTHVTQPLLRGLVVDLPVGLAAALCFLQGATSSWLRRLFSPGLTGGFAAVVAGLGLGVGFIFFWNQSSLAYIDRQYADSGTSLLHRNEFFRVLIDTGFPLLIATSIILSLTSCINEFFRPKNPAFYRRCTHLGGCLLLCMIASTTIIISVCFVVFMLWPEVESHGWIFGHLIEGPPRSGHPVQIMVSLMVAGALVSWTVLLRRPVQGRTSCFRTLALVCTLLGHMVLVAAGLIEFDLPSSWKIYPQGSIWLMFTPTATFLFLTLVVHSSLSPRPPNKNDQHILMGPTGFNEISGNNGTYPLVAPQPLPLPAQLDPTHIPYVVVPIDGVDQSFHPPNYSYAALLQRQALIQQALQVPTLSPVPSPQRQH